MSKSKKFPKNYNGGRKYVDGFTRKEFVKIYLEREKFDDNQRVKGIQSDTLQSFIDYANEHLAIEEDGTHIIP